MTKSATAKTAIAPVTDFALHHPITAETEYEGVVLPNKPPIDKVVAATLVMFRNSKPLTSVTFWDDNQVPLEKFGEWRDAHQYPIDMMKYHEVGVASATDYTAIHLGMVEWTKGVGVTASNLTPGFEKLRLMINKNNKKGHLRAMKFSVPYLIRETYELKGDDTDFHAELVSKAMDIVQSFATVENGAVVARSIEELEAALPDLVSRLRPSMDQPLTIGRYLSDLWFLGTSPQEIREKVEFWLAQYDAVANRLAEAEKTLSKLQPKKWSAAGEAGIVLRSDDHFLLKAATRSRQWGIRIVVTGPGHTTISTNQLDLSKMYEVLKRLEPDRWYYQPNMGALINGGPQYTAVEPTGYSTEHLIQMLQSKVQPKAK